MQINRNDPCPCGSGQKYKRCCAGKQVTPVPPTAAGRGPLLAVVIVLALGTLGYALYTGGSPDAAPPGGTPDRVWSEEHGHWHGPDGRELPDATGGLPTGATPSGGGPGQVWSEEHGHWHNSDGSELSEPGSGFQWPEGFDPTHPVDGTAQPSGGGPGQVWSEEHGHWHDEP